MTPLNWLPLVGRSTELASLRGALDAAGSGQGRTVFLSGDGGVGKTRLARALLEEAEAREWRTAHGRAYAAETGVPYSLFADALLPVFGVISDATRTIITRGAEEELLQIFPSLAARSGRAVVASDMPDLKNRLLWNFTQVLKALGSQKPLCIVLEDLQWADASSLELLHFAARQTLNDPILLVCSYNSSLRDANPTLLTTIRSLESIGHTEQLTIAPLTLAETGEAVTRVFGASPAATSRFSALLFGWTRGNPFFITEVLRALVDGGKIRQDDGRWTGWDVERVELPASIRDAVMQRARRLTADAFGLAEMLAAFGRQATYEALLAVSGKAPEALLDALAELLRLQIISERAVLSTIAYDFAHPLGREAFLSELGETRGAALHLRIAQALETLHGSAAADHADELAFHFSRARGAGERAAFYLRAAGNRAFDTFANREAVAYLSAALERMGAGDPERTNALETLARAQQRLGGYEQAAPLWQEVRTAAAEAGDFSRVASVERRMGVACFWTGRFDEALGHYERGLKATLQANDYAQQVAIRIARAMCLQEMGRLDDALPEAQAALELAGQLGDERLCARAHRALLLLYVWNGPPGLARAHGAEAVRLLAGSGDRVLAFSAHWAIGVLEGLTGNSDGLLEHSAKAEAIAEEVRSPVLQLWTDELAIEYGYGAGDWSDALERGERAIELARALNQRTLLPRLLVWTALMHLGRNNLERARSYIDDAWQLAGADRAPKRANVHVVVPAHTGLASYHLATGDYEAAISVAGAGLEIAERSGYTVWAVHRLLPVLIESHLYRRDIDSAVKLGRRLRQESQRLDHKLGLAWADACDALVVWLAGDPARGAIMLRSAAERLEQIPYVPDAARVRRQLAGRLAEIGDREGALRELRQVHDILAGIGAERELIKTREMFRELGARLPVKEPSSALSDRELEIVRLVLAGRSNKAIGKALDISVRTVSTHLTNIFRKLDVSSRADLLAQRDRFIHH
jgi:DNA-binding CsgD family transcriptional regulator